MKKHLFLIVLVACAIACITFAIDAEASDLLGTKCCMKNVECGLEKPQPFEDACTCKHTSGVGIVCQ